MLVSSDRFKVNDLPKTHVMRRTNQNRVCLIFECYFHIIYILSFLLIVEHTSEIPTTRLDEYRAAFNIVAASLAAW